MLQLPFHHRGFGPAKLQSGNVAGAVARCWGHAGIFQLHLPSLDTIWEAWHLDTAYDSPNSATMRIAAVRPASSELLTFCC